MARATRAKPAPKEPTPEPAPSKPLPRATPNPPKLFVLPKDTATDARIVTLDNPATNTPSRYYFCPSKGFYEFTRIAAPKKACRSWLITSQDAKNAQQEDGQCKETQAEVESGLGSGFVAKDASLFLATPIDLLFLILPALAPKSAKEEKQHFLALDDYADQLAASSPHWKTLLAQYPSLRGMLQRKMRILCDTVDAGDETMYRISHSKLLSLLVQKAERMVKNGLPPSMEDKFVKTALDVPVMSIRREDSTLSLVPECSTVPAAVDSQTSISADSQTSMSAAYSQTSISAAADSQTSPPAADSQTPLTTPDDAPAQPTLQTPPHIPHLLRLRTALTYLTTSYLPPSLQALISAQLSSSHTPDFTALSAHLAALAGLRADAAALRSIGDNISRKRQFEVDEDMLAAREEKKRRKDDEALKKRNESLGVKKLRKVDTSGMRKMSAFFSVKPKAK